jgi:branched-chain amino acid transport system permease protein
VIEVIVAGLAAGAIYALVAMGFNVIFATTHVLNFAHGDFLMLGAVVGLMLITGDPLPVLVALVIVVLLAAGLAIIEERVAIQPAKALTGHTLSWVISTLGFAIVIRAIVGLLVGGSVRHFPQFLQMESIDLGNVIISPQRMLPLVVALGVAVGLYLFFDRSINGAAFEAVAEDADAAALRGLPVKGLSMGAFALGSAIAALTGFLSGPLVGAFPAMGFPFVLKGFIAAAIGGIPSIGGALAGGLLLGVIEAFGVQWIGAGYRSSVVFGMLLLVLVLKPSGLAGTTSVRSV